MFRSSSKLLLGYLPASNENLHMVIPIKVVEFPIWALVADPTPAIYVTPWREYEPVSFQYDFHAYYVSVAVILTPIREIMYYLASTMDSEAVHEVAGFYIESIVRKTWASSIYIWSVYSRTRRVLVRATCCTRARETPVC